jgi:hypothetical protein
MKEYRKRIWIHPFQTGLLVRIVLYCFIYQVTNFAFFSLCDMLDSTMMAFGADRRFFANPLVRNLFAVVVLLPPLTVDAIRFAHRLVGPLYRFQKTIRALAAGEPVALIQLRKNDFLVDLKEDFNAMLLNLEQKGYVGLDRDKALDTAKKPLSFDVPAAQT